MLYRPGSETQKLLNFTRAIETNGLNNNKVTLSLFIDPFKAFDASNHEILLDKLGHYRVGGITLQWFKSCLFCRKQFVQYNGI